MFSLFAIFLGANLHRDPRWRYNCHRWDCVHRSFALFREWNGVLVSLADNCQYEDVFPLVTWAVIGQLHKLLFLSDVQFSAIANEMKTETASVAEWLRTLIFSALNRPSSHRCGFEPSSGHMWNKPNFTCGWAYSFSQGSPVFASSYAQNESNSLWKKTLKKKKKKIEEGASLDEKPRSQIGCTRDMRRVRNW